MGQTAEPYTVGQVLYRVEDKMKTHWGRDYSDEIIATGSSPEVTEKKLYVLRVTPKGAWLTDNPNLLGPPPSFGHWIASPPKWIPLSSTRRVGLYAARTLEQAYKNAIARREHHIKCLKRTLRHAEQRLRALTYNLEQLSGADNESV